MSTNESPTEMYNRLTKDICATLHTFRVRDPPGYSTTQNPYEQTSVTMADQSSKLMAVNGLYRQLDEARDEVQRLSGAQEGDPVWMEIDRRHDFLKEYYDVKPRAAREEADSAATGLHWEANAFVVELSGMAGTEAGRELSQSPLRPPVRRHH